MGKTLKGKVQTYSDVLGLSVRLYIRLQLDRFWFDIV